MTDLERFLTDIEFQLDNPRATRDTENLQKEAPVRIIKTESRRDILRQAIAPLFERIQELTAAITPVSELKGAYPVVLFFENEAEAQELIKLVKQAKPNMEERQL